MNRRDFVTGLLSVPVAGAAAVAIGECVDNDALSVETPVNMSDMTYYRGRKAEYIIVDDPYREYKGSERAKHREILAKWYNSKIDTLVFRSLTHG